MPIPQLKKPDFRIRKIGAAADRFKRRLKPEPGWKNILLKLKKNWLASLAILALFLVIAGVGLFAWFSRDLPDPDKILERSLAQSTKIYASDGETLLYEIHGDQKRTLIQLADIPKQMVQATIAIEDHDFYKHSGFDLPGIAKAVCHEIFGNLGGLCPQRGGSTITQQLVKNAILTSERSYARKAKELILSYQLEKKFTKDQILQMYLNEIPYGSTAYGIESAAQTFLGKSAKNLTLSESAFLAALPQLPTYYSPYGSHVDELSSRLHLVLNEMVKLGYITEEAAAEAKKDNILERMKPKYEVITAPHFVMYVREILSNKYGEKIVEQGGLKVTTTLNIDKQKIAEEAISKYAEKNAANYNANNAALVCLDTKTGQILAMVGSKNYFDETIDGNVNVALRPRQPGSSFKPLVYLTAFGKGYPAETILFDLVTNFKTDTKDYSPKNYNLREHGPVTMRQALAGSLNIPAVKTLYLAGINNVLDTAEKFGYTTFGDRSRFGLSLVLGGGEVTLLEHTAAFATFAREGLYHPPTAILRVEDASGKLLEEFEPREKEVFDAAKVRVLNNILSDDGARAYIFGAGSYLTLGGRPVAAKTGTTNDYRDAWTMGYTPSFATGVWVGNNDNSEMRRGADGSIIAAPIWHEFMSRTVGGPVEPFNTPDKSEATKPVLNGNLEGETALKVDKYTGKLIPASCQDTYPQEFVEEKVFRVVHNILYYVDKEDPLGPLPADPTVDPQYTSWEEPVRRWAEQNNYLETKPAEESCDFRSEKNRPVVTFSSPAKGTTITTPELSITVNVEAVNTILEVNFYLDDKLIGTDKKTPFTFVYRSDKLENGFHDLKVEAVDVFHNTGSAEISINYLIPAAGVNTNTNSAVNTNTNLNSNINVNNSL